MRTQGDLSTRRGSALLAVALLLAAGAARAERDVERHGPAPADGLVLVENVVGKVAVLGWDREEISLTGRLGDDVEDLEFSTGAKSRIKVVYPKRGDNLDDGAELEIHVPRGCRLEVSVVSADVDVRDLRGDVEVESVSGEVVVNGRCRELRVTTVSGGVTVDGAGEQTSLATVTGRLRAAGDEADLRVETVTGAVSAEFARLGDLTANSVSGRLDITAGLAPRATFAAESINGEIVLTVPADVDADFLVTTFNGDIDNEFGPKAKRVDRFAPGQELEFTRGDGKADVRINTLNGAVHIRKR